jgi:hypothetical protein
MIRYASSLAAAAVLVLSASVAGAQDKPTELPATTVTTGARSVTVQNDRHSAVTFYIDAGKIDRPIGTVAAGEVSTLALPEWALKGQRTVKLVARAEGEQLPVAEYALPMSESREIGVLVPPRGGVPLGDSALVALPAGTADQRTVTVKNERNGIVTVFAEQGLMFVPLGEVAPKSSATLVVPESLRARQGEIRVFMRAGAREMATRGLKLNPGDHVSVIVM